jgi:hypothetical protein
MKIGLKNGAVGGFLVGFGQFSMFGFYALSFWYGGKLISDGKLEFVDVMKCLFAIMLSAMMAGQSASGMHSYNTQYYMNIMIIVAPNAAKAKIAASNVFKILDHTPDIDSLSDDGKNIK